MFDHTFIDNKQTKTLVLLHGTGGDKSDLLFFDRFVNHKYNLLSLQGNVNEHGMWRFFARKAAGVFDQESITRESELLKAFITEWLQEHQQSYSDLVWLGNSNGANMILAILFRFPELVGRAVLMHPMLPFNPTLEDLSGVQLFVSQGELDQMIVSQQQLLLQQTLQQRGAELVWKTYQSGHQPTQQEIADVIQYLLQ